MDGTLTVKAQYGSSKWVVSFLFGITSGSLPIFGSLSY